MVQQPHLYTTAVVRGVARSKKCRVDMHGECAEREFIMGSEGRALSGVQGQSPWSGGQGAKPPPLKLKTF